MGVGCRVRVSSMGIWCRVDLSRVRAHPGKVGLVRMLALVQGYLAHEEQF